MERRLCKYKSQNNIHVRGQGSNPSSTRKKKKLFGQFFCLLFSLFLLDLVIYFANVWNETEADNTHERRDFSKSSLRPFFHGALQMLKQALKS